MKALSLHVVDVANGRPAAGLHLEVACLVGDEWISMLSGTVAANGEFQEIEVSSATFDIGQYEVRLHVAAYYRGQGMTLPAPPFMDVQVYRFGLADLQRHYHLPLKFTPWGLSCFLTCT